MNPRVRQLVIDRVFGGGAAGFAAASGIGWLIEQYKQSQQPERLDTARLVPGETYLVTTRPPMSRKERRDAARLDTATARLDKMARPGRKVRRTARKLATAQRRATNAKDGSRRQVRSAREAEVLGAKFDRLTTPTPKQVQLQQQVEDLSARLEQHRRAALTAAASSGKRRPARTRTFR